MHQNKVIGTILEVRRNKKKKSQIESSRVETRPALTPIFITGCLNETLKSDLVLFKNFIVYNRSSNKRKKVS